MRSRRRIIIIIISFFFLVVNSEKNARLLFSFQACQMLLKGSQNDHHSITALSRRKEACILVVFIGIGGMGAELRALKAKVLAEGKGRRYLDG
jgi:hypothetical protein